MQSIFKVMGLLLWVSTGFADNLEHFLPDESNTIEVFQQASPKVVYVHRLAMVVDPTLQQEYQVSKGSGSGIIWDKEGHVVTNYHVIQGAQMIAVSLGNVTVPAKLLGAEPRKDIAVLALESPQKLEVLKDFKPFEMANSSQLLVGQKAIAIGNPFGLDHSLTIGVISALGRQVPGAGGVSIHNMVQTDASINPGNSGGPLLDSKGRLLGLNSVIFSGSGASAGVGFAVPAEDIERSVTQIIAHGRVSLAGIGIQRVEPNIAKRLGVQRGILIGDILPKTPAANVGLHKTHRDGWGRLYLGDVLIGLNGHPINDYDDLYHLLTEVKIGDEVIVTVLRGEKKLDFKMKTIDIEQY